MWPLLAFAAFAVLMPLFARQLQAWDIDKADELLEASFATQHPVIHGVVVPASTLRVLYRWRTNVMSGRGGILEADANWLCQTADGLFAVAIGQGAPNRSKATFFSLRPPFEIRWTWRSLSEERVRQILAATPSVYRDVFGTGPDAPH